MSVVSCVRETFRQGNKFVFLRVLPAETNGGQTNLISYVI